jgi:hypothetical protein
MSRRRSTDGIPRNRLHNKSQPPVEPRRLPTSTHLHHFLACARTRYRTLRAHHCFRRRRVKVFVNTAAHEEITLHLPLRAEHLCVTVRDRARVSLELAAPSAAPGHRWESKTAPAPLVSSTLGLSGRAPRPLGLPPARSCRGSTPLRRPPASNANTNTRRAEKVERPTRAGSGLPAPSPEHGQLAPPQGSCAVVY